MRLQSYDQKNLGSDHFAMYYKIYHKKKAETSKNSKLNGDEKEEIEELIEEGENNQ